MNDSELIERWESEKPVYAAWGRMVLDETKARLEGQGKSLDSFFKIQPGFRLKDAQSLVDKAFHRPEKRYSEPYSQIEDKVGVRFVVLLIDDIKDICRAIEESDTWTFDACKHFDEERKRSPLLFTYQSVHYIVRPKVSIHTSDFDIDENTACEIQIRTLLQHAHAELTHDAIYKSKRVVQPEVQRTVAKSMALIETTDQFFVDVTKNLNYGPLQQHRIVESLNSLYFDLTGTPANNQKSAVAIWDAFENFIDADLIGRIRKYTDSNAHIASSIKSHYLHNGLYQQSVILFVYWLIGNRKQRLLADWPLARDLLLLPANDLGVSLIES